MLRNVGVTQEVGLTIHDRNKIYYVTNGKRQSKATVASMRYAELHTMDSRERQKLVRMPKIRFLERRFVWE